MRFFLVYIDLHLIAKEVNDKEKIKLVLCHMILNEKSLKYNKFQLLIKVISFIVIKHFKMHNKVKYSIVQ